MKLDYFKTLGAILVAGCVFHPAASALGLLIILAYQLADKYLSSNISDKDRAEIAVMKAELAKVKQAQQTSDLSKAFGPR